MLQSHYQTLRPLTTAHLAQTMTLLELTAAELVSQIETELAANPALELVEERRCPSCGRQLPGRGFCPTCSQGTGDEPIVFVSPREDFHGGSYSGAEDLPEDNFSTTVEDLPTYVLRQIALELEPEDRPIAAYLLTQLDEDGFLAVTVMEVARYYHVLPSRVEQVIRLIQHADPIGVGSKNVQEALLIQLAVLAETRPVPELAVRAIRDGMDLLLHRQHAELARMLKTTLRQTQEVVDFISENLNPFPARSHWGSTREPVDPTPPVFHQPDILISYANEQPENPLVVEIIMPLGGTLRVNPLFKAALREASEEKAPDWKSDLERASLFVKCIQQRNHTMQRLMQRIVSMQQEFIRKGEAHLRPLTRALIAEELGLHESTISRAVSDKAVQLPNGRIIPLSKFFDRSLNVRTALRTLVQAEEKPLSDTELARQLAQQGFVVARRTVAKYRAMEGILPAHLRHSRASMAA